MVVWWKVVNINMQFYTLVSSDSTLEYPSHSALFNEYYVKGDLRNLG